MKRLLLVVTCAVAFSTLGEAAHAETSFERSWISPGAFIFDATGAGQDDDPMNPFDAAQAMHLAEVEHTNEISAPAAIAERETSVDAFTDLGGNAAIELVTDVFDRPLEMLTTLPSDAVQSSESAPVFLDGSDTSVRIDPPGSEDSVLYVSSTPLRNENEELVSGAIEPTPEGFKPAAPLTDVAIPGRADGSVDLSNVGISFDFPSAADTQGRLVNLDTELGKEMVFYPNTDLDTDTAVTYSLDGVETFSFLRSEDSPEAIEISYSIPNGAILRSAGDGGAVILDEQGQLQATVLSPTAVDAQGTNVPITMRVSGGSLILDVPHRGEDFAYPIMVDPVTHVRDWWTNGSSAGFEGWIFHEEGTTNYNSSTSCPASVPPSDPCKTGTGSGVYVSMVPSLTYPAGSKGYWRWTVPGGTDSYIASADMDTWRYREGPDTWGWAFYNIDNGGGSNWTNAATGGGGMSFTGGMSSKYIHVGLMTNTSFTMPTGGANWRYNRLAAYSATLNDLYAPTLSLSGAPAGWMGPNTTANVTADAQDSGLGLGWITATVNGTTSNMWLGWCTGTYPAPCPRTPVSQEISFNSNDFTSGINTIPIKARDIVSGSGHEIIRNLTLKVDKVGPTLSLGAPFTGSNPTVDPYPAVSLSAADAHSGVSSIDFRVDNESIGYADQDCPGGGCSFNPANFELDTWGIGAGTHSYTVVATDIAGNTTTRSGTFTLNVPDFDIQTDGALILADDSDGWLVGDEQTGINIFANDLLSGITHLRAKIDGGTIDQSWTQTCASLPCPITREFVPDLTGLSQGTHTVDIIATAGSGATKAISSEFVLESDAPTVDLSGAFIDLEGTPLAADPINFPDGYPINISATTEPDIGVATITLLENGEEIGGEQTCSGTCPTDLDTVAYYDPSLYPPGTHDLELQVTDTLGNTTTTNLEAVVP